MEESAVSFCFLYGMHPSPPSPPVWYSLVMCQDQPADQHVRPLGTLCASGRETTTGNPLQGLLCPRPEAGHLLQCTRRAPLLLVLQERPLQCLSSKIILHQDYSLLFPGGSECEGSLNN